MFFNERSLIRFDIFNLIPPLTNFRKVVSFGRPRKEEPIRSVTPASVPASVSASASVSTSVPASVPSVLSVCVSRIIKHLAVVILNTPMLIPIPPTFLILDNVSSFDHRLAQWASLVNLKPILKALCVENVASIAL